MRTTLVALFALVVTTLAAPSHAHGGDREYAQQVRIADGIADGEVTSREARVLEAKQKRIDQMQRRAARNGIVSAREQRRIERAQDRAGHGIHRAVHNARDAK